MQAQESALSALRPAAPTEPTDPAAVDGRRRDLLAVGALDQSRLLAIDTERLTADGRVVVRRTSLVVGGPISVVRSGEHLIIAATNHPDLVRLGPNWRKRDVLRVKEAIGVGSSVVLDYGSVVAVRDTVLVSVAYLERVALVSLDPSRWRIRETKVLPERFGGIPRACLLTPDTVAVLSKSTVPPRFEDVLDLVDAGTLEVEKSIPLPGDPVSLACGRGEAWLGNYDAASGAVVGSDGSIKQRFTWKGRGVGAGRLIYDTETATVYGTDSFTGILFACRRGREQCRSSRAIGAKPTDVARIGSDLIVTLETDQRIAVVDADSLTLRHRADFPTMPRTLTPLRS